MEDEDCLYCLSLVPTLKCLSQEKKDLVKLKLQQLLHEVQYRTTTNGQPGIQHQQAQFHTHPVSYVPQGQMSGIALMQGPNQITQVSQPQGQTMQFHYVNDDSQILTL